MFAPRMDVEQSALAIRADSRRFGMKYSGVALPILTSNGSCALREDDDLAVAGWRITLPPLDVGRARLDERGRATAATADAAGCERPGSATAASVIAYNPARTRLFVSDGGSEVYEYAYPRMKLRKTFLASGGYEGPFVTGVAVTP
jgi:hypothetical protein